MVGIAGRNKRIVFASLQHKCFVFAIKLLAQFAVIAGAFASLQPKGFALASKMHSHFDVHF